MFFSAAGEYIKQVNFWVENLSLLDGDLVMDGCLSFQLALSSKFFLSLRINYMGPLCGNELKINRPCQKPLGTDVQKTVRIPMNRIETGDLCDLKTYM